MGFDLGTFLFGGMGQNPTQGLNPQGQYGGYLGSYMQSALGRVNNPVLNFGQANQDRSQMSSLAGQLGAVASGQQKGAGELAVERQMGNATAAQQAAARMARGANAALAARQAARNIANLGVAGAGQAQQAALQDQADARAQLAGVLGQMQGGDLQQQELGLQQYGAQNNAALGYLGALSGLNQQGFQNQAAMNQLTMSQSGLFPYLLSGAGSVLASYAGRPAGRPA
jgi:hypothetical protein